MKDRVHKTAQLELDSPADWQPVQLKKAGSDVLACAELEDQASSDSSGGAAKLRIRGRSLLSPIASL